MNKKLNCPVCGYQNVEGKTCPQCHADLSLIHQVPHLTQVNSSPAAEPENPWTSGVSLLMLMIGITVGIGGSFFAVQNHIYTASISSPRSLTANPTANPTPVNLNPAKPQAAATGVTYKVKSGDTLSSIAAKFCGQATVWQLIVEANPELKAKENKLSIDQELKIPGNCKAKAKPAKSQ
jgi:phage tail protein X